MPSVTRIRVKFQNQERLPNKYSYCDLYSVNNALQDIDYLTPAFMRMVLARLAKVGASVDHGHPLYGAYTTQAPHLALQKNGKQLRYLNRRLPGFKRPELKSSLIVVAEEPSILIIDRRPGQLKGTWHCIARARVGDKFVFIDSDEYRVLPNRKELLVGYFEYIDGVYCIEDIVSNRVKRAKEEE